MHGLTIIKAALKRNKFNTNTGKFEADLSLLGKGKDSADVMVKKRYCLSYRRRLYRKSNKIC